MNEPTIEDYREYFEARGFALFGGLAAKHIEHPFRGSCVIYCDPIKAPGLYYPHTTRFPNDLVWTEAPRFPDPVQAYLYAELAGWGLV